MNLFRLIRNKKLSNDFDYFIRSKMSTTIEIVSHSTESTELLLGTTNHKYPPKNTFVFHTLGQHHFVDKRIGAIWFLGIAMVISAGILYGTLYQQQKNQDNMYQRTLCNTTHYEIMYPETIGIMSFKSGSCNWVNVQFFDCSVESDRNLCLIEKSNQFNNPAWPCIVRKPDSEHIDCDTIPRLTFIDPAKSLVFAMILVGFIGGGELIFFSTLALYFCFWMVIPDRK
jgi:hypothetical protein